MDENITKMLALFDRMMKEKAVRLPITSRERSAILRKKVPTSVEDVRSSSMKLYGWLGYPAIYAQDRPIVDNAQHQRLIDMYNLSSVTLSAMNFLHESGLKKNAAHTWMTELVGRTAREAIERLERFLNET